MEELKYLLMARRVGEDLARNAGHSYGIDFAVLNEFLIETEGRIAEIKKGGLVEDTVF